MSVHMDLGKRIQSTSLARTGSFGNGCTWKLANSGVSKIQVFVKYHAFLQGDAFGSSRSVSFSPWPKVRSTITNSARPFPRRRPPRWNHIIVHHIHYSRRSLSGSELIARQMKIRMRAEGNAHFLGTYGHSELAPLRRQCSSDSELTVIMYLS